MFKRRILFSIFSIYSISALKFLPSYSKLNNQLFKSNNDDIRVVYNSMENDEKKGQEGTILQERNNEIYYYGPIGQESCFYLKNLLIEMDVKSQLLSIQYGIDPPPIHLHIQSQGGSLYHTLYIIDLIQSISSPVYTYVDGFAASAATLITVVGKKRFMTKNSLLLIHQLSGADSGKFEELQDQLINMNSLMRIIVNTYINYTSMDMNTINYLLRKDLWLNSTTCLQYGLVDEII